MNKLMLQNTILCVIVIVTPSMALAAETEQQSRVDERLIETVTVIGTRTERSIKELASTVSITFADDIERQLMRNIDDLVRFEPGVTVAGTGSRFGLGGFNIRGIGGNRVLTLVDGVRVPEEFSFGPFLSAQRDFVDIDSLQRAEIARGPVSSLYGSDALGGVVAFTTKGPRDYLQDESWHVGFKGGYSSADAGTVSTATVAAGSELISGLLLLTRREAEQTETSGSTSGTGAMREMADPQDIASNNFVAKLSFHPSDTHTLTLGFDHFRNATKTEILSDYGLVSRGTTVNTRDADDERDRTRISLSYGYDGQSGFADRIQAMIYQQESESQQITNEARTTPLGITQTRFRAAFFAQDIQGAYVQFGKTLSFGDISHYLTYGADYYRTDSAGLRNGGTADGTTGIALPEFFPFPTRDFPPTKVEQSAFFLQDEIALFGDKLLLSPGIRYDRFQADTSADPIYIAGNPGTPLPEDYDDSEVTAKLGVVYTFSDLFSVFGQYSEGFRAPPYDDVNVGFSNFIGGYKTISNPDLRSERSTGVELGFRVHSDAIQLTASVFRNDYEDFIESFGIAPAFLSTGGIDPIDGLRTFQSVNRSNVVIDGAELSASINLGSLNERLNGFSVRSAIAYANGEDQASNSPVNSVEPLTGILGLSYAAPGNRWGADLVWTLVGPKNSSDIDASDPRIPVHGYGIVDLLAHVNFGERVQANIGLFNLGDKRYIRWADTAGIGNDATGRFTRPGFNTGLSVRVSL